MITSNQLAILRTKLANQRTYLAYLRTGLAVAALGGYFKYIYIFILGLIMMVVSFIQYYLITKNMNEENLKPNIYLDYLPLIYIIISFIAFYLQYKRSIYFK
jgi:uncharacterized membrane protein YidH (DUF202 family)